MDPQGRILLEQCGQALREVQGNAGTEPLGPAVGVYVGVMHMEFIQYMHGADLACTKA